MSNGEMLYLALVLTVFFSFIVVLAYGIISSAQARRMRTGSVAVRTPAASPLPMQTLLKAA